MEASSRQAELDKLKVKMFESLNNIRNFKIRRMANDMLLKVPESFWTKPSSFSHHSEDEKGVGGLLIHSLRVDKMIESFLRAVTVKSPGDDLLRVAAKFHDVKKFGPDGKTDRIQGDHDILASKWVLSLYANSNDPDEVKYSQQIAHLIEVHMGRWGTPFYYPETSPEDLLHLADYVVSREFIICDLEAKGD